MAVQKTTKVARRATQKKRAPSGWLRQVLVHGELSRAAILRGTITGASLRNLRSALDVTIEQIAPILGASERTIQRKELSNTVLSLSEADRAYRVARVVDAAVELIGDRKKAIAWVKAPHHFLGGETPLAMLDTEIGTDLVMQSLYAIAYGGVA